MSLDLLKVAPQVAQLGRSLEGRAGWLARRQRLARDLLAELSPDWEALAERVPPTAARFGEPREPLLTRRAAPPAPADHVVVATDGSQIEPDRHGLAEYFLINVGWAVIRYGARPDADLASEPRLYFEPEELAVLEGDRRVPIRGGHLAALRAVAELERVAALAEAADGPAVALQDGTLLLWVMEDRPVDFLRAYFLGPYARALERLRAAGRPLASYVSRPRSAEVTSLLRDATCGGRVGACRRCVGLAASGCPLDGLADRTLFSDLAVGERSALFAVRLPAGLAEYYVGHRVHFCYLNVGAEIARLEVPEWVAADPRQLDLVQAVVLRQCELGQGYPVALARAHEQAVVTAMDRAAFALMLEAALARLGLEPRPSEKLLAKRLQAV